MRTSIVLTFVVLMIGAPIGAVAGSSAPAVGAADSSAAVAGGADAVDDASPDASVGSATEATQDGDACAPVSEGEPREDPDEDQLGWENGCWYDEPLDVDRSDGLNDTELDAVVGRAMARVEEVREIEFQKTVPVDVITREEYAEQTAEDFSGFTENDSLHQNVKWEAMFVVNESTDALEVQQDNRAGGVLGYYSPSEEQIVIVSDNPERPEMDEITLSQELYHALQDQKWNLSQFVGSTEEENNAYNGIVEGDGNYVDYLYNQRCESDWNCLLPEGSSGGAGYRNVGMVLPTLQAYVDGPAFVRQLHEEGGWEAVNDVYENPPQSTEQTIHPEKYPDDEPTEMSFEDRSGDDWEIPDIEGGVNYAEFGEAGLFVMLYYPSFVESQKAGAARDEIIPYNEFFTQDDLDSYDYQSEYTDGWDGDRLYPYVTGDSAETNETGYVWKTVWDSEADAQEFVDGYQQLLEYHDAEPVPERQNTFRIPDDEAYGDAFWIHHDGDTVTIVNAPSVEELSGIRDGAAPEATTPTPTDTPAETESTETPTDGGSTDDGNSTDDDTPTDGNSMDDDTPTEEGDSPGFGTVAALLALVAAALLARRR